MVTFSASFGNIWAIFISASGHTEHDDDDNDVIGYCKFFGTSPFSKFSKQHVDGGIILLAELLMVLIANICKVRCVTSATRLVHF